MLFQRIIEVVAHSPNWVASFTRKSSINKVLGTIALKIEHIGSTSVASLPAKPVIDILIEVTSIEKFDRKSSVIKSIGILAKGEN